MSESELIHITHWTHGGRSVDLPFTSYQDAHGFLISMYYSPYIPVDARRAIEGVLIQLGPRKLQKDGDLIEARYDKHYVAIGIGL